MPAALSLLCLVHNKNMLKGLPDLQWNNISTWIGVFMFMIEQEKTCTSQVHCTYGVRKGIQSLICIYKGHWLNGRWFLLSNVLNFFVKYILNIYIYSLIENQNKKWGLMLCTVNASCTNIFLVVFWSIIFKWPVIYLFYAE